LRAFGSGLRVSVGGHGARAAKDSRRVGQFGEGAGGRAAAKRKWRVRIADGARSRFDGLAVAARNQSKLVYSEKTA
jgi:hypothetical protein